jgi:CDP-glucose 4,6-dehydratase
LKEDYFSDRNILVTGATGLVGSWLTRELLARKANVIAFVRDYVPSSWFFTGGSGQNVTVVHGNLEDFFSLERAINEYEIDSVIHLGAQTIVGTANASPLGTFHSNIAGTWNVLEACRLHDKTIKSIVVASSDKAYGDQKKLPYTEESPLQGRNPYDASKSCADLLAQSYGKTYRLPIGISRCGNFFGGGDLNFNRLVPGTIKNLYYGRAPVIRSDGKYVRDYIYVKDAVNAYCVLAEKTEVMKFNGEAFNFSNENQFTVLEMVDKIIKLMDKNDLKPIVKNEPLNEIRDQHLSADKAKKVLGWRSEWTVDKGLKETISWYIDYFKKR